LSKSAGTSVGRGSNAARGPGRDGAKRRIGSLGPDGDSRRRAWLAYPAVILLALLPLVPALLLPYLPTVDGPAHVLDAYVMAHYGSPHYDVLRQYYVLSASPTPNLLTQVLLAGLLRVLSPGTAEKVFAVVDVTLFAVGVTYAVRSVDRRSTFLATLAAPLATGYLFYFGFYNFSLGTGLSLFTIGLFLRCRGRWTGTRTAVFLVMVVATASAHLLPFGMAALAVTVTVLTDLLSGLRWHRATSTRRTWSVLAVTVRQDALPPLLALVLPTALTGLFLLHSPNIHGAGTEQVRDLAAGRAEGASTFQLRHLARVTVGQVTVYSWEELALGLMLFGMIALLVLLAVRQRPRPAKSPLLPFTGMIVLCVGLYVVFPDTLGTLAFINVRFALFGLLFTLLALAAAPHRRRVRIAAVAVAIIVAVGLPIARIAPQRHYTAELREYASAAAVLRPGSTFVTFRAWRDPSPIDRYGYYDPTAHQDSRIAMASQTVQLNHLDGRYDYFPAHFRNLDRLGARISDLDEPRLWLQLLIQSGADRSRPDYILVWGRRRTDNASQAQPVYREAMQRLNAAYRRVWISSPQGLLEVYVRR